MKNRSVSATQRVMSTAQKWFTGVVTTVAAVMTLALNAKTLGLSSFLGMIDPDIANHAARRIIMTPRVDTLRALGDTSGIIATVTDAHGALLAGARLQWRSSDTTVARVDSGGVIIARAPGRSTIEVTVRDITATAAVLVRQAPAAIRVVGDSVARIADGDSLRLGAVVVDAHEHPIVGLQPKWIVPDTQVVRLAPNGDAVATLPGRTLATVAIGDLSTTLPVEVVLTPATLERVDTLPLRGLAGRAMSRPVTLRVLTRRGQPVPGATVAFTTENGEGSVAPANAVTDAEGRAKVQWTLGARAGRQQLHGRLAAIDSVITFVADADPSPKNARVEVITSELRGTAAALIEHPARVRVTDTAGVALAQVRVTWRALNGGAAEGVAYTDTAGFAEAQWTLGRRAGWQELLVQVGDARYTPAARVRARAEEGAPASIAVVAGDRQTATVGKAPPKPIVVAVRDSLGNGVPNVPVRVHAGATDLVDTLVMTGADGNATVRWMVGLKAGAQRIVVQLEGSERRDTVVATARAGSPATVELTSAKATGGKQRLTAKVVDEHGNAVRNASLVFAARAGKLSRVKVTSDSLGRAVVLWTPPVAKPVTKPAAKAGSKVAAKPAPVVIAPTRITVTVAGTKYAAEVSVR